MSYRSCKVLFVGITHARENGFLSLERLFGMPDLTSPVIAKAGIETIFCRELLWVKSDFILELFERIFFLLCLTKAKSFWIMRRFCFRRCARTAFLKREELLQIFIHVLETLTTFSRERGSNFCRTNSAISIGSAATMSTPHCDTAKAFIRSAKESMMLPLTRKVTKWCTFVKSIFSYTFE